MKIAVIGTGYVGLVTGTCLAETGNEVLCIDIDQEKVNKMQNGEVLTNGGRVLAVTSFGKHFSEALKKSYQNIDQIDFDRMYYRKDIGFDL